MAERHQGRQKKRSWFERRVQCPGLSKSHPCANHRKSRKARCHSLRQLTKAASSNLLRRNLQKGIAHHESNWPGSWDGSSEAGNQELFVVPCICNRIVCLSDRKFDMNYCKNYLLPTYQDHTCSCEVSSGTVTCSTPRP
jgi:hypothetical protein